MPDITPVNPDTMDIIRGVEGREDEEQQVRIETSATTVIDDALKTVDIVTPLDEILAALGKEEIEAEDK